MGVLNNIKETMNKALNRNKVKALNAPQQSIYERNFLNETISFPTNNLGEHVTIKEIRYSNQINHSNERNTNLMLATVSVGKDGYREMFDGGDVVAFEAEPGIIGTQNLLKKIAYYYLYEKSLAQNQSKDCYYIGEVNNNEKDNFMRKSHTVQMYIDNEIVPKINLENQSKQIQYEASLRQRADNTMQNLQVRKIDNPISNNIYIKRRRLHDEEYEKMYHDYDATKTDTGTVLRIRKLNKVCKDINGRYLYTGFLKEAYSEFEGERIYSKEEDPLGIPVCFTLDGRFEDIVKKQEPSEMKNVLAMLSAKVTFDRRLDRLNYIGNVDRNGNINRDLYINSPELVNEITKRQQQFFEKMQSEEYYR